MMSQKHQKAVRILLSFPNGETPLCIGSHPGQVGQESHHISGKRSAKLAPLLTVWMLKADLLSVQGLAWEGVNRLLWGVMPREP